MELPGEVDLSIAGRSGVIIALKHCLRLGSYVVDDGVGVDETLPVWNGPAK